MVSLSPRTKEKLRTAFAAPLQDAAALLLMSECADNLPFHEDAKPQQLDRVRAAVLQLSEGDLEKLLFWIDRAKLDWREVLKASGLGHTDTTRHRWQPGSSVQG